MRQRQLRALLGYLHRVANPDRVGPADDQLLDRWRKQRDTAAFEVLVWRHGSMVWNACRRLLAREQDAEDAFQATFLAFLRKADTIGQGRFLGSWLYKVAYRTALKIRTASAKRTVHADLEELAAAATHSWDALGPVLDEEVNRLPEKYRRPFVLCYLEGKTTDEAARDLGYPRGTVGTRLAWARERLRTRLAKRGLTLSAVALTALLAEKAAAASVPAPAVASIVEAASCASAGKALAAGVISARALALAPQVLRAMFLTKLNSTALMLFIAGTLLAGAGLLAEQALAERNKPEQIAGRVALRVEAEAPANQDTPWLSEEDKPVEAGDPSISVPDKAGKEFAGPHLAGTVAEVGRAGKSLILAIPAKGAAGMTGPVNIQITDRTLLAFSNVGPDEAGLREGYSALVWLQPDSQDIAARVHLSGRRNVKQIAQPEGQVVAVSAGGQGITVLKPGKGAESPEKLAIRFDDRTALSFFNVGRDGARLTVGYEPLVRWQDDSHDTPESVTFVGTADAKGKETKADRSGRLVGVSADGKILTVEIPYTEKGEATRTQIKLTKATRESYYGVSADGAKPTTGYLVHVWLVDGSPDTAARVKFIRNEPRESVDGTIVQVSRNGDRFTLEASTKAKTAETYQREIQMTGRTKLLFSNVGPGGARLTEGYQVHGWLMEGSPDCADVLMLSRSEKTDGKKEVVK